LLGCIWIRAFSEWSLVYTAHRAVVSFLHVQLVQRLPPVSSVTYTQNCRWIRVLFHILRTDMATFIRNGISSLHISYEGMLQNSRAFQCSSLGQDNVSVQARIMDSCLIRPYILENHFIRILERTLPCLPTDIPLHVWEGMWFLHDVAPPYSTGLMDMGVQSSGLHILLTGALLIFCTVVHGMRHLCYRSMRLYRLYQLHPGNSSIQLRKLVHARDCSHCHLRCTCELEKVTLTASCEEMCRTVQVSTTWSDSCVECSSKFKLKSASSLKIFAFQLLKLKVLHKDVKYMSKWPTVHINKQLF
jgi:hypothetical protein